MSLPSQSIVPTRKAPLGEIVTLLGQPFYCIHHYDAMDAFFMTIVSSSDHWLFISSTGGLTAGRASAEQAIFPYTTVDKVSENSENTGPKCILWVTRGGQSALWEPFSQRQQGAGHFVERNLYKNISGTALVFEEINAGLGLAYRYAWRSSERFGLVKTSWLENRADSPCAVRLVDGLQNILPAKISSQTQNIFSPLLDAYKRAELHPSSGMGLFSLSSRLTDLAEPSESLLATTVAQVGLDAPGHLLSSLQLERFRAGEPVEVEREARGQRCAYFVHATIELAPRQERSWHLLADTGQDASAVVEKIHWLAGDPRRLADEIEADIAAGQEKLWQLVAGADGIQLSQHPMLAASHFANVMFNLMRGGIFADQYWIDGQDFHAFVATRNRPLLETHAAFFAGLPERIHLAELQARADASGAPDLARMSYAYLPLTFSRRHGDPSRPWNRFAINIKQPDGARKIDYEGNWRDIFQNWEALAYAFPEYVESMIATFLNATSLDGYNPYRITHHGLDWEVPEPGNPWSNIGYWSDHQIIYLQKLMEASARLHPGRLATFLDRPLFSYANVPYRIKPYEMLVADPHHSIDFDWDADRLAGERARLIGSDGKLVLGADGQVLRATLAEKLITLLLAKLANFVPEGGIWMNTQRPEWNDANNALVGKGLSVVTLCYLRRALEFYRELFATSGLPTLALRVEIDAFFREVFDVLRRYSPTLAGSFSDRQRRAMLDDLGRAGSRYRWEIYRNGLSGRQNAVTLEDALAFLDLAQQYVEHSLRANRRADALYHAYNILHLDGESASISRLTEMLEGQVAALSSGLLDARESLALLESLRASRLYQPSTHSYILYPDRDLPGFLEKNCLTPAQVEGIGLVARLLQAGDRSLIARDADGNYHFGGQLRNAHDLNQLLDDLKPRYAGPGFDADADRLRALFEQTFHHDQFTGRSGTFFAYEGLGSVYWHMVAKLLLAAQEVALRFKDQPEAGKLIACYNDIRQGLSFNKTPAQYGAFPADPYSHTPKGQGARQPGMTGSVKEIILTRQAEVGLLVENGCLRFDPLLVDSGELLRAPATFTCLDVGGQPRAIPVPAGALAFTCCQTPILLKAGQPGIEIHAADGAIRQVDGLLLDAENSRHIFTRDGQVRLLVVSLAPARC